MLPYTSMELTGVKNNLGSIVELVRKALPRLLFLIFGHFRMNKLKTVQSTFVLLFTYLKISVTESSCFLPPLNALHCLN